MAILIGSDTRLIVQGITGHDGAFHTGLMKRYGTTIVGGVTPGKGGISVEGVPVFDTMRDAAGSVQPNTSIIFVPAPGAADAIMEAAASGITLIVCITEMIPVHDAVRAVRFLRDFPETRLIGPNCPGLITPGSAKVGIMPEREFTPGHVGIVSRSGTLTYEVGDMLSKAGFGQSTCVGIGGDPVIGSSFVDVLSLFQKDAETHAIVLIGEIGGSDEEDAARYIGDLPSTERKPVLTFISGRSAPPGKRMGHAGAIISGGFGGPDAKVAAFRDRGLPVADAIPELAGLVESALRARA